MVRKQVFTALDVVRAGIELVDREGWDQLTARKVADVLGSSTAPVYSNFANMGELAAAVVDEALRLFGQETHKTKSGNPFLDFGLGVLDFAMAHPRWYEALFREVELDEAQVQVMVAAMARSMAETPDLADLDEFERNMIMKKMSVFTHGLASEICTPSCGTLSREEMALLMEEVGQAVVEDAHRRPQRTRKEMEMLRSWQNCCQTSNETGEEKDDE